MGAGGGCGGVGVTAAYCGRADNVCGGDNV